MLRTTERTLPEEACNQVHRLHLSSEALAILFPTVYLEAVARG